MADLDAQVRESQAQVEEAQTRIAELTSRIETARAKIKGGEDASLDIEIGGTDASGRTTRNPRSYQAFPGAIFNRDTLPSAWV